MTDEQIRLRGWSVPLFRAVEAAGGPVAVAAAMGFKAMTTPMYWYKNGTIRRPYIFGLCELGNHKVTPEEIISDLKRRAERESEVAA